MPWKETSAMDQRIQLIADWLSGEYCKNELCRIYGISRPTGDKWIRRYDQRGLPGLEELGRAPHRHPNQTAEELRALIVQTKLGRQKWGPKKVLDWLRHQRPELKWPADSTAGEILKRAGLVQARQRRRRVAPYSEPFRECGAPNQSWSADFKGDFLLGNSRRCYPLTISDNFSRYLLLCRALERPRHEEVRPWFEWVFRQSGLPEVIRTDNGTPFASLALGGLSQLSKWWIKLGIKPERIRPGKPAQNGRHERMHRTLKQGVAPQSDLPEQQRQYDPFVEEYNWERSHEALGRKHRGVFIAPLRAPIRPNSRRWNMSLGSRSGECVITVKSSGAASCFTSRKSWQKSPWGSNRSTRTDGNCVTVFIFLGYSMKETKALARPQVGMELNEPIRWTACGNGGKTKDVFPPFPQPLLLRTLYTRF